MDLMLSIEEFSEFNQIQENALTLCHNRVISERVLKYIVHSFFSLKILELSFI